MARQESRLRVSRGARAAQPLLGAHPEGVAAIVVPPPHGHATDDGLVWIVTPEEFTACVDRFRGASVAVVLWLAPGSVPDAALLAHPVVAGVLHPSSTDDTVFTVLQSAFRMVHVPDAAGSARMLEQVLEIGRALASEKDLDRLLSLILTHARSITGADGASVYTRDQNGELYFRLWQNASNPSPAGMEKKRVGPDSIAGYVARSGEAVIVDEAYAISPEKPYRFNPESDRALDYHTRSLLTLPLTNKGGDVVGVLQLINRKDDAAIVLHDAEDVARHVRPFDARSRQVAQALAGQAGVALENSMLYADIERLFEGFIKASVQAIEARDPTTAGHSFRVADFTERLAMAVDRCEEADLRRVRFTRDELRELRYAALLHDFGKVGVREDVLVKAKKLYPHQLEAVKQRFRYARLSVSWRAHRRLLDLLEEKESEPAGVRGRRRALEDEISAEHQRLDRYLHAILRANEPTVLHASAPDELRELLAVRIPDEEGDSPLLHDFEFSGLTLPKGSLSPEERVEIESHVSHTYSFLKLIPWTRDLARLPEYAYAHHEKLDGTGYPRGLARDAIPLQARMMTISDIYDALTAPDRPYKLAVPPERAMAILEAEARAGKIDAGLLRVFIESGAFRTTV